MLYESTFHDYLDDDDDDDDDDQLVLHGVVLLETVGVIYMIRR
jgi:hypothetical protein